jgi:hypothetical protein
MVSAATPEARQNMRIMAEAIFPKTLDGKCFIVFIDKLKFKSYA